MRKILILVLILGSVIVSGQHSIRASHAFEVCAGFTSRLPVGSTGQVTGSTASRLRQDPALSGAQVGSLVPGELFLVVGEPRCADNLTWLEVLFGRRFGWLAEGSATERYTDVQQPIKPKRRESRAEMNGGTNGNGGDGVIRSQCTTDNPQFRQEVAGYYWFGALATYNWLPNGQNITLTQDDLSGQSSPYHVIEICSPHPIANATATYNGRGVALKTNVLDGITSLTLPDIAFAQSGTWTLAADGYKIIVTIPAPAKPIYNFLSGDAASEMYTLLLAGFKPNERIVMIVQNDLNGNTTVEAGEYEALDLRANEAGYFLGKLHIFKGLSSMMFFIGENGSLAQRANLSDDDLQQTTTRLRGVYWGAAPGSAAGGDGPVAFFYQRNGAELIANVQNGTLNQKATGSIDAGWTSLAGLPNALLLLYNRNSGAAQIVRASADGMLNTLQQYAWNKGWTHIAAVRGGLVFFYRADTGDAAVSRFDPRGTYTDLKSYKARLLKGWTHITALGDGRIAFYRADDGAAALGTLADDGTFTTVKNVTLNAGWTQVAAGGGDLLLFYNIANGVAVSERVGADGSFSDLKLFKFISWTHVVGVNGSLVFYNAANGTTVIGVLNADGSFTQGKTYTLPTGYQTVVATH